MADRQTLNCANHPDRLALERCEVCATPLCAYCLYYTEDGQRLCGDHAAEARRRGVRVEEPGAYADQLLGAQVGALSKRKRDVTAEDADLYKGNSTDLMSLIGLLVGVFSLGACCGALYCMPLAGGLVSLVAVINARKAYDPGRTRRLGWIGLLLSGVWIAAIVLCIGAFMLPAFMASNSSTGTGPIFFPTFSTLAFPIDTPTPLQTGTPTPEPTRARADDSAAALLTYPGDTTPWPVKPAVPDTPLDATPAASVPPAR